MIDGHAHLFHPKVIENVRKRLELVQKIRLNTKGVDQRIGTAPLERALRKSKIQACLVLTTALPHEVGRVNDALYENLRASDFLYAAGTLHPNCHANRTELLKFNSKTLTRSMSAAANPLKPGCREAAVRSQRVLDRRLIRQGKITHAKGTMHAG